MTVAQLFDFNHRHTARPASELDFEMVIDNFAGAGGASLGIEAATGRAVDKAINHSPFALEIHGVNHPNTEHLCGNIWDYAPLQVTGGRPVGLAWFSPDCKHFSRAKGGKPVEKKIRGLAWVVIRWAKEVRPRVIILENVPEFQTWGPLLADNTPCLKRKGQTFQRWKRQLEKVGYAVETRELIAADYGVPTIRKRFFLIARCDGQPIVWPERTHAPRAKAATMALKPWRPASECIDWNQPCPSIFERKRPLAEATMKRIANGVRRYVIESAEPFIITCNHQGGDRTRSIHDPMMTLTSRRDAHGVVMPTIVNTANSKTTGRGPNVWDVQEPLRTITSAPGFAVAVAELAHGDGPPGTTFGDSRTSSVRDPIGTVHAGGGNHAVVSAALVGVGGRAGQSAPRPVDAPLGTCTAKADVAIVEAFLAKHYGGVIGHDLHRPIGTVTSVDHHSLVAAHLTKLYGTNTDGADVTKPMPTTTSGGLHVGEVRAFLIKYFGANTGTGGNLNDPAHTVTAKPRFGLVTVQGAEYVIADIGLRMLNPRELLRAQFGRFADEYILIGTKAQQVAAIGNSVPPELAEALVRANVEIRRVDREVAA